MDVQKVSALVLKSDEVEVVPAVKAGADTKDTTSNKQLTSTQRNFVMPDYFFSAVAIGFCSSNLHHGRNSATCTAICAHPTVKKKMDRASFFFCIPYVNFTFGIGYVDFTWGMWILT